VVKGTAPSPVEWRPGTADVGNLRGTITSWNEVGLPITKAGLDRNIGNGVLSRDGWAVVDDLTTARFSEEADEAALFLGVTPSVLPASSNVSGRADEYFFACPPAAFTACLSDLAVLSGPIVLPPLAAFGVWWSHYEPYSAQSIQTDVLSGYANYSLPLNVLQMDVDWHRHNGVKPPCQAYNGYDWNPDLFPDPTGFVATVRTGNWTEPRGPATKLKLILNTHNFAGVGPCQSEYEAVVAAARKVLPNRSTTLPFNVSDMPTMDAVFRLLLQRNASGPQMVGTRPDWWWTDGSLSKWTENTGLLGNRGNLFASTYMHSAAIRYGADAANRPVVMPRWAGLGQQRYCCGFSGDTRSSWTTLRAEVNVTKTAANVGFAYWSHDIGGFDGNPGDELYARWAQFGAVSPIYRSHGASVDSPRRPWLFKTLPEIKQAMQLRATLVPLLYTLGHAAFQTGVAAVRSMYIDHPTEAVAYDDAYAFQFQVGPDIVARPVVHPLPTSGNASLEIWLPAAATGWVGWIDGSRIAPGGPTGGRLVTVVATIDTLPLFVRGGTVLPLLPPDTLDVTRRDAAVWAIFPGAKEGMATRYIDDGVSVKYEQDEDGAFQNFSYSFSGNGDTMKCNISAVAGLDAVLHTVELRGGRAAPTSVRFNGKAGNVAVISDAGHTLARPRGTVVLSAPGLIAGKVEVEAQW